MPSGSLMSGVSGHTTSLRTTPGGVPKARSPLHQVSLNTAPDLTSIAIIRSPRIARKSTSVPGDEPAAQYRRSAKARR